MTINSAPLKIYKNYLKIRELDNEMTICTVNFVGHNYADFLLCCHYTKFFSSKLTHKFMGNIPKNENSSLSRGNIRKYGTFNFKKMFHGSNAIELCTINLRTLPSMTRKKYFYRSKPNMPSKLHYFQVSF